MVRSIRYWIASRILEVAELVDPTPLIDVGPAIREAVVGATGNSPTDAAFQSQIASYGLVEVEERSFVGKAVDGDVMLRINRTAATAIRHLVDDCESGACNGFRITWLGPGHPVQSWLSTPEDRGAKA